MRETTIAIPVPSGSLGIKLIGTNLGTVISEVNKSSFSFACLFYAVSSTFSIFSKVNEDSALARNVCPGDRIISIDDIDVHQMDTACESALLTFF